VHTKAAPSLALFTVAVGAALAFIPHSEAQRPVEIMAPGEAREELERATKASEEAEARVARFTAQAEDANAEADRAANERAALAARIQVQEARIEAARARYSIAQVDRARLVDRLAKRQEPLVRLTAALQTTSRRPLALSALQPGSLKDLVYVRAVLDSAVPQIQERTASLRGELEEGRRLERRARRALTQLREGEAVLQTRRTELAAVEQQQRLASKSARDNAAREADRALALAEDVRDLDGLIERLDQNAIRRRELAALAGPVLRPTRFDASGEPVPSAATPAPVSPDRSEIPLTNFQLPVQGRTITGFGEPRPSGLRSRGLRLRPPSAAQVVAPASGRVAFSGPYEGFGRIVIIEHPGGWSTLITGLGEASAQVGDTVIAGSPLGAADSDGGAIGIELRRQGEPVNPLDYLR
jgi:septal ring factor EnvC (AmiA/AmiB activator)